MGSVGKKILVTSDLWASELLRRKQDFREFAPVNIVDEFAYMNQYCDGHYSSEQECKRKGMPVMEYPNSNGDFYYSGETKIEEGSYWIDEDEPSPF